MAIRNVTSPTRPQILHFTSKRMRISISSYFPRIKKKRHTSSYPRQRDPSPTLSLPQTSSISFNPGVLYFTNRLRRGETEEENEGTRKSYSLTTAYAYHISSIFEMLLRIIKCIHGGTNSFLFSSSSFYLIS